jgi:hypothetical protein
MKEKITFELKNIEYTLPEYISIENYTKLMKIKDTFSDQFFATKLINILTGSPLEELLSASYNEIEYLANYCSLLFPQDTKFYDRFEFKGINYGFIPDWKTFSFAEYVDLDTLMSKKPTEILDFVHNITAIMFRPIISEESEHKFKIEKYNSDSMLVRAEIFKEIDIKYFIGGQFFFTIFIKKLSDPIPESSIPLRTKIKMIWKNRKLIRLALKNDGDGSSSSIELAQEILRSTMKSSKKRWWKF